ncbi:MAG: hypothetical protein GQ583_03920 [Methyloprofundus sp.]|nr:hypothetical protein [Methyloprofundus sp.]
MKVLFVIVLMLSTSNALGCTWAITTTHDPTMYLLLSSILTILGVFLFFLGYQDKWWAWLIGIAVAILIELVPVMLFFYSYHNSIPYLHYSSCEISRDTGEGVVLYSSLLFFTLALISVKQKNMTS